MVTLFVSQSGLPGLADFTCFVSDFIIIIGVRRYSFRKVKSGTNMNPVLDRIILYPVKSLDGVEVSQVEISPGGTLKQDRIFAIMDETGQYVNGKRHEKVHGLRSNFDLSTNHVTIRPRGSDAVLEFDLNDGRAKLESWLTAYFGIRVRLTQNVNNGFPDDSAAWGPTIVSTASLNQVKAWFPEMILEGARARFRANLELNGVPAFWEDRLFSRPGTVVDFEIGTVRFQGVNPCQRCVVPSRDPWSGQAFSGFQQRFSDKRRGSLPEWTERSRFDHYYRLAVNTRIAITEAGKLLKRGDEVKIFSVHAHTP
jgi:uncharacterized protein YcbX